MASDERVTLVDAANCELGWARRSLVRSQRLWHRATFIFVFNAAGELLVQRRTADKDVYPSMIDLACGGVVLAGETFDAGAVRESHEELGIDGVPLRRCFDFRYRDAINRCHGAAYRCHSDGPFRLQAEEVAEAWFVAPERVVADMATVATPDTLFALRRLLLCGP